MENEPQNITIEQEDNWDLQVLVVSYFFVVIVALLSILVPPINETIVETEATKTSFELSSTHQ